MVVVVPRKELVVAVHHKEVVRMGKEGPVGKGLESEMASGRSPAEVGSLAVAEVDSLAVAEAGIRLAEEGSLAEHSLAEGGIAAEVEGRYSLVGCCSNLDLTCCLLYVVYCM